LDKNLIHRNWDGALALALIISDVIIYNAALPVAYYLRWSNFANFDEKYYNLFIIINVFFIITAALTGLYRGLRNTPLNTQRYNLRRFTYYMALFLMSYLFLIKGMAFSRGVILIFLFVQYMALDTFHHIFAKFRSYLVKRGVGSKNTLIVGADDSALEFYQSLRRFFSYDYQIMGFLKNGYPKSPPPEIQKRIIGAYEDIQNVLDSKQIDRVFIVSDSMLQKKYEPIRRACEDRHIKLKMVSPQTLSLFKSAKIKDITGVPLTTEIHRRRINSIKLFIKRSFDIALSGMVLLALSPFLLLIALIIKLTSPGPVIFKQKRSAFKGGKEFYFLKFRTMYVDAEERKKELSHLNETNGALFKMKKDPRVTPFGRFLRKYSLDELPQFINVLKGDMSIVGPRPLPVSDFDNLQNGEVSYDWYIKRGEIKSGITGLWQISGRSHLSFEEMVMLDLYYIENQSFFFDMEIMFETIPTVLTSKGAY